MEQTTNIHAIRSEKRTSIRLVAALTVFFLAACAGRPEVDVAGTVNDRGDAEAMLPTLHHLADDGFATAQYLLGRAYALGDGVAPNPSEADAWFRKATEQDPHWARLIGDVYNPPGFQPRDMERAVRWYERAAEGGDGFALVTLGHIYLRGDGVPADPARAYEQFARAAAAGDPAGHTGIGSIHFFGDGRAVNYRLARKHFLVAAGAGESDSQHLLGTIYRDGLGTEKDPREAARWFTAATKSGHTMAPRAMAEMYLTRELAADDSKMRALAWYVIGMYMGDTGSRQAVQRLYMTLPTDSVRKAAEMADAFLNALDRDNAGS
jgi:hypothetical protein